MYYYNGVKERKNERKKSKKKKKKKIRYVCRYFSSKRKKDNDADRR